MKEIIDRIVDEENKARQAVQDAQAEADRLIAEAKAEAGAKAAGALKDMKEEYSRKLAETQDTLLKQKDQLLQQERAASAEWLKNKQKNISRQAETVFAEIIKVEE
ncbi:MAG: hypothetical protein PHH44_08955 [bacterium]|nr:hypothetical protein [bacterium]